MDFEVRVGVAADPATVWRALMAVEEWPAWTESMTTVDRIDEGPLRIGSRAKVKQPGLPALVWEVDEFVDGEAFSWAARSPGVVTAARHTVVQERPDEVTLILTAQQRGFLAGLVGRLYGGRTRRYLTMEAEGLKAWSEQSQTSTT